eukprot:ANDGO_04351.mRNA.1 hypothetical protein
MPSLATAVLFHTTYAASIASFLGAVHWGHRLSQATQTNDFRTDFVYSVVPSIASWTSLVALHDKPVLHLTAQGMYLIIANGVDQTVSDFPPWYKRLRWMLTAGAAASLASSAIVFMSKERELKASNLHAAPPHPPSAVPAPALQEAPVPGASPQLQSQSQ